MKAAEIKKANRPRLWIPVMILLLAAMLLPSCKAAAPYEQTNYVMGSVMQQTVYGSSGKNAAAEAYSAAVDMEYMISWKIGTSEISRLNENAGKEAAELSPETASLLMQALDLSKASNGAFDPTILPLSALWDFDSNPQHAPEQERIQERLALVSADYLKVSENSARLLKEGCGIDLGAAGKGAACDAVIEVYREQGVRAGVVSVGGSIGVFGRKPDGSDYRIAVRDPAGTLSDTLGYLTISTDAFVSTSGDYEKYFVENGIKYSHILDSKTGYPAKGEAVSVTVIANGGAVSDMLSTACYVLGAEKSRSLLENYGAAALFVYPDGEIQAVGDLEFTLTNEDYQVKTP